MTVEERAQRLASAWFYEELKPGDTRFDELSRIAAAAITAAIDERERELVTEFCLFCQHEERVVRVIGYCGTPDPDNDWAWWFHQSDECEEPTRGVECYASPLRESIYQREKKADA